MAVDAVRYGSRNRKQSARAAKARREKIILAVGGGILVLLLVWQGPKTLKALQGTKPAPPAAVTSATGVPGASAAPSAVKPVDLKQFDRFASKDPFVSQVATQSAVTTKPLATTPPAVRTSHFVAKDPFVQQVTLGGTTAPGAPSAAGGGATSTARGSYIVMVASIPVSDGHDRAARAAALARKQGVAHVGIVLSSSYPTLRSGFYAVYSGPYPSLAAALTALEQVRGHGYVSAYTRRFAR